MARSLALLATVALAAALLAGCGGGGDAGRAARGGAGSHAEPAVSTFPAARRTSFANLRADMPRGPILASSVSVLTPGRNRVGFALFDRSHKQITASTVALYTAAKDGSHLRGPFRARFESLAVRPRFRSRTAAQDPDAAHTVYVAQVPFAHRRRRWLIALARLDGRVVASGPVPVAVSSGKDGPPDVGQRAIPVHTPTLASVGGHEARIETRDPPDPALQRVDFVDVLGRRPVVLLFATPKLCQSRVCGLVVDVEAQVQARYGARAAFIHQEVYRRNDPNRGIRPQLAAWRLPGEPWAFVIDRHGRIVARFEGAFSATELARATRRAITR